MSPLRLSGWLGVAALLGAYFLLLPQPAVGTGAKAGPVRRLFGPFARLAADVQWIRFDRARMAGRHELAIARAEFALSVDPTDTRGWDLLASFLAIDLASIESEPDPLRRLAWTRAGLDVARRGERTARDLGALAFLQGYILYIRVENDPELPWPGGPRAMWLEAAEHFERASERGYPKAELFRDYARERAGE